MKPALSLLLGLTLATGPHVQASAAPAVPLAHAQAEAAGGHWREAVGLYERAAEGPPSIQAVQALVGAVDACGRLGAFDRAEGFATRAIAAAEGLQDGRALSLALTAQARLRYRQEQHQEAETLARRGLAAAEQAGASAEIGLAAFYLGEALLETNRWPEAAQALEQAVGVARRADPAALGERLQTLALARYYLGDPASALAHCEEAVTADRKAGQSAALVERLSGLAVFHIVRGQRFGDARILLDEALALSRQLGRRDLEALVLQRVAALESFSERHETALRHQQAALGLYRELGMETGVAQALSDIGDLYKAWDRPSEAKRALAEALAAETRLGRRFSQAMVLRRLAELHLRAGEHDQAIGRYEQALAIHQALGKTLWLALTHMAIGGARYAKYDYPGALAAYDKALAHARQLGNESLMATCYEGAASVHSNRGRYDQAVALAEQALTIHRRLGQDNLASYSLQLIASAYENWGQSAKAIETYETARAVQLKLGNQARAAGCSEQIAAIQVALGDYDEALTRYQAAIAVYRRLSQPAALAKALKGAAFAHRMQGATAPALALYGEARGLFAGLKQPLEEASVLEAMGVTHRRAGHLREALACLDSALDTARRHRDDFLAAGVHGEIGRTHQDARAYAKAVAAYREAIALFDRLETPYLAAVFLNEMAYPLALQGRFPDAAKATRSAIDRIEALRATADGEARRDFLAKQVSFYEDLVVFSSYQGRPEPVYLAAEQGRARMLSETLAKGAPVAPPPLSAIRQGLAQDSLVLSYTGTAGHQVQLAIDKQQATVSRVQVSEHFRPPSDTVSASAPTAPRRGVAVIESEDPGPKDTLAAAVHRYRALLQSAAPADQALARRYGRALYDVLIKPQAARLKGKKDLVIVPSAELAPLPFETLIDEEGRYMAEGFRVRYAQSLTVWHQLRARRHPADRKPMLAVGGARYGRGADRDAGPMAPGAVRRWVARALEDRGSLRPIYQALGLDGWTDLPGTRDEVAAIARAVPNTTVLSGEAASEHGLKALPLDKYRVIHLATHGLVVPGVPALSALVLSQFPGERGGEDGYLRMDEIAAMKLRADFVNLSACETGLGTVYGGEGVVGLAQAVLVAGANGVSVSLWQVADDSTARLMTALYEAAQREKVGHAEAMARIKRRFIRGEFGEAYRSPYHWAPFVYYGL